MQKVAVIGLGRFGMALARGLAAGGAQVMAIDNSRSLVDEIKDDVDLAVRLNATDEDALRAQEIDKVDVCVVAIGENFEAALLTLVIAKKLGAPRVIVRAQSPFHAEIFRKVGADEVIQPEQQAGEHLARRLASPHVEDYIRLAEGYTLIEFNAPQEFHGKSPRALDLRRKYGVNLIAVKRRVRTEGEGEAAEEKETVRVPRPDDVIEPGEVLVVVGPDEELAKLPKE